MIEFTLNLLFWNLFM